MLRQRTSLRALSARTAGGRQIFLADLPMPFWYACDEVSQRHRAASWFDLLHELRDQRLEAKHGIRVDDQLARALWDEYLRQMRDEGRGGAA
ncbi:MAG: hypothetical protein SFU83_23565 [Meiothermus sp.]|nr:hypothetical protein [Meiothermus sp.]